MQALLISTYDLGRQPFGLASPAAWLRAAGWSVVCADLSKERLDGAQVRGADLIAFHLPMHTATRLAQPVIDQVRRANPRALLCAFGLYAPLNADALRAQGVTEILGGEFEPALTAIAARLDGRVPERELPGEPTGAALPRIHFLVPDRSGLPPLSSYATLRAPDGRTRVVGYTEASRGCRHLCRHCPVVPIYNGQFRIVQPEVVLADIAAQVAAGAGHITFGDPDFLNGPAHAMRVVELLHAAHPEVTYDVTIKVEHLLRHRALLPRLRDTGCAFVTSAVESLDDRVLVRLDKGHTRRDFFEAAAACRAHGVVLTPTFVAFHPWLTLQGYCDLLAAIAALDLVDHVAPIQLAIRLLIPNGSRLLELPEVRDLAGAFDTQTLTYRWTHADPRVDALQRDVAAIVGVRLAGGRREIFNEIGALAHERAGLRFAPVTGPDAPIPLLSEPWYCCAEPNPEQVRLL
ncbi:MAG: radical SAM protein [Acidobacteria bacterium]|nr:radical SAM protein [Acidobacteriota bacterium]